MMERPSFIGNYLDFLEEDISCYSSIGSTELLGIGSAVGKKLGLTKIGIHVETLLPGRRTSFPHAESDEEEFGFVLEGTPDVWANGNLHRLAPGDFVAFPAGTGIGHTFINNSSTTVRLLIGGEATKKTNKIYYHMHPEGNKSRRERGDFWEDIPRQELGPHDGMSDLTRDGKVFKSWNLTRIETQNLLLRGYTEGDAPSILHFAKEEDVTAFIPWGPYQRLEEVYAHIKKRNACCLEGPDLALVFKSDPTVVIGGLCAFWANKKNKVLEIGAVLAREHWGKGLINEALTEFVNFCWNNMDVRRIQACARNDNTNSVRLLKKIAVHEGTLKNALIDGDESRDMEMFYFPKKS